MFRTHLPHGAARRRHLAALVLAVTPALTLCPPPLAAGAQTAPSASGAQGRPFVYQPPTDRPVADPFRRPVTRFLAGNRGIEYRTVPGDSLRAIGDGVVVFAGAVGGRRWVTIGHPDGLRSSYGPLAEVLVRPGERVRRGRTVGLTGAEPGHLGVRRGQEYLDPASLFGRWRRRAVLITW